MRGWEGVGTDPREAGRSCHVRLSVVGSLGSALGRGVCHQGRGAEGGSRETSEEATVIVQEGGDGGLGQLQAEP